MSFEENLQKYAALTIRKGCNLQEGQELYISADVTQTQLVRLLTKEAYEAGASLVTVRYTDELTSRIGYDYRSVESFSVYPDWQALMQNGLAKRGAALLFVSSEDPQAFAGVDQAKLQALTLAADKACKDWRDGMDFGRNVWVIIGAASPAWARQVFPDLPEEEALAKLWGAIFMTVRVDTDDPQAAWDAHRASFAEKSAWLNEQRFDRLHYTNSLGTDLTVGLNPAGRWEGGGSETVGGTYFFPNMPTEEIFTSPNRLRADGVAVASMPLNHDGAMVEDFSVTFRDGVVVDYQARVGRDVLQHIIETDEGSHHLGEVALVPKESPIKRSGILFLNTLFDENAACHIALGTGFPECLEGGLDMTKEQLLAHNLNQSAEHVDFMIGTDDLYITGVKADGTEVPVFRDGTWAF